MPTFTNDEWRWALANHGMKKEREGRANGLMMAAITVSAFWGIPDHTRVRLLKQLDEMRQEYEPEEQRGHTR